MLLYPFPVHPIVSRPRVRADYRSTVTVSCRGMKTKFLTVHTQWANSMALGTTRIHNSGTSLDPLLAPIATAFGPSESRALSRFARLRVGLDRGPGAASGLLPLLLHPVVVSRSPRHWRGQAAYRRRLCRSLVRLRPSPDGISPSLGSGPTKTPNAFACLPAQDQRDDRHQGHHPPHCEPRTWQSHGLVL